MSEHRTVLVVDDDPDIRDILVQVLEEEGYRVAGASNGREALSYLRSTPKPPCVILLDLMMPIMNGWQFRVEQQRDPEISGIPVVVITATGDAQRKAANVDAAEVLEKPIELDRLIAAVARACAVTPNAPAA